MRKGPEGEPRKRESTRRREIRRAERRRTGRDRWLSCPFRAFAYFRVFAVPLRSPSPARVQGLPTQEEPGPIEPNFTPSRRQARQTAGRGEGRCQKSEHTGACATI